MRCVLFVVYCVLCGYCLWYVAGCVVFVVWCMRAMGRVRFAVCVVVRGWLCVGCRVLFVVCWLCIVCCSVCVVCCVFGG